MLHKKFSFLNINNTPIYRLAATRCKLKNLY
nr:MAG TPA: hypothetical protein [Bacteriophage sp.]